MVSKGEENQGRGDCGLETRPMGGWSAFISSMAPGRAHGLMDATHLFIFPQANQWPPSPVHWDFAAASLAWAGSDSRDPRVR